MRVEYLKNHLTNDEVDAVEAAMTELGSVLQSKSIPRAAAFIALRILSEYIVHLAPVVLQYEPLVKGIDFHTGPIIFPTTDPTVH